MMVHRDDSTSLRDAAPSAAAPLKSQKVGTTASAASLFNGRQQVPQTTGSAAVCCSLCTQTSRMRENLVYLWFNWGLKFKWCWIIDTEMLETDSSPISLRKGFENKHETGTSIVWKVHFSAHRCTAVTIDVFSLWLSLANPVTLYGTAMCGDTVPGVSASTQRYHSLPQTLSVGFHSAYGLSTFVITASSDCHQPFKVGSYFL